MSQRSETAGRTSHSALTLSPGDKCPWVCPAWCCRPGVWGDGGMGDGVVATAAGETGRGGGRLNSTVNLKPRLPEWTEY